MLQYHPLLLCFLLVAASLVRYRELRPEFTIQIVTLHTLYVSFSLRYVVKFCSMSWHLLRTRDKEEDEQVSFLFFFFFFDVDQCRSKEAGGS